MRLKILSYNIHKGKSALGVRNSLPKLQRGLHLLRSDIVFMQEVQGRNEHSRQLDKQHQKIAKELEMQVVYGVNADHPETDHGNVLLSRYPILYAENQDISDHRLEQRGVLHVRVQVQGVVVHCFVVHLGLFKQSRKRQLNAIVQRIQRLVRADEPLILAGDFNDWNEKLETEVIEALHIHDVFALCDARLDTEIPKLGLWWQRMRETWSSHDEKVQFSLKRISSALKNLVLKPQAAAPRTFPAIFPWLRLDRMYQRGFYVHSAEVLKGKPWTEISDHAPLLVELELIHPSSSDKNI